MLDEPELGLDGAARGTMRAAVESVRRRGGAALVVTHEPANWLAEADLRLQLAPGGAWRARPAKAAAEAEEEGSLAAATR